MKSLSRLPDEEINKRVDIILDAMGVTLANHNSIAYQHTVEFARLLIKCEGMNPDQFKHLAKITLCLSEKYIDQYYKGFASWEVFRNHKNKIVMTDQDNDGNVEE